MKPSVNKGRVAPTVISGACSALSSSRGGPCSGGAFISLGIQEILRSTQRALRRFGFHNASSIDSLLDKDDVALEALLDEDDLLQECKAQNTRLIDYFQRQDVLKQLFGYVTGQIEPEEGKRFKCVPSPLAQAFL